MHEVVIKSHWLSLFVLGALVGLNGCATRLDHTDCDSHKEPDASAHCHASLLLPDVGTSATAGAIFGATIAFLVNRGKTPSVSVLIRGAAVGGIAGAAAAYIADLKNRYGSSPEQLHRAHDANSSAATHAFEQIARLDSLAALQIQTDLQRMQQDSSSRSDSMLREALAKLDHLGNRLSQMEVDLAKSAEAIAILRIAQGQDAVRSSPEASTNVQKILSLERSISRLKQTITDLNADKERLQRGYSAAIRLR